MSTTAQPTETVHAGEKLPQQGLPQQGGPERLYMPVRADKIVSSRGFYIAKIVMGCLILAFDVVVFGLSGGIAASYYYGPYYGLVFTLPVAIVSFLWQVAEFITLCVQKQRGIHPGAHVGMHLIIWLGAAASVGLMSAVIYFEDYYYYNSYYDDYYSSGSRYSSIYMLYKALVAFMALLLLLHFTLFVRACVECNRRNKATPTVMLVPAAYVAMGQMPATTTSYVQVPPNAYTPNQAQAMMQQQQQPTQPYYDAHTSYYAPAPVHQQPVPYSTPSPVQGQQHAGGAA